MCVLILYANKGDTAKLNFSTCEEAKEYARLFMLLGQYCDWKIQEVSK